MPVVNSKEMAEAEIACGVPVQELMDRAGNAVAGFVMQRYNKIPVVVMCGVGNNGGDGFVAAKVLLDAGWDVRVVLYGSVNKLNPLALSAFRDCSCDVSECNLEFFAAQKDVFLLIDAIFGTGLNADLKSDLVDLFKFINSSDNIIVVSVDVPTGVNANTGSVMGAALKAHDTVTFASMKIGHLLLPGKIYSGDVIVCDIGIPIQDCSCVCNSRECWGMFPPALSPGCNKYSRGYTVVYGSSVGLIGASKLAAQAALRAGSGVVAIACDTSDLGLYSSTAPSIMLKRYFDVLADKRVTASLVGPGSGVNCFTMQLVLSAISNSKCLLDADALTVFRECPERLFSAIKASNHDVVITPHLGEFTRIFNFDPADKLASVRMAAEISGATVLLKGDDTIIADSNKSYSVINNNAVSRLATAGSGDVLSGIIAGFIASGYDTFSAACAGVWVHARCAGRRPEYGMVAEDLINELPLVLTDMANGVSV